MYSRKNLEMFEGPAIAIDRKKGKVFRKTLRNRKKSMNKTMQSPVKGNLLR
jgi:hypothetical protein